MHSRPVEIQETESFRVWLTPKAYRFIHADGPEEDWGLCGQCRADVLLLRYQPATQVVVCVNCWEIPS